MSATWATQSVLYFFILSQQPRLTEARSYNCIATQKTEGYQIRNGFIGTRPLEQLSVFNSLTVTVVCALNYVAFSHPKLAWTIHLIKLSVTICKLFCGFMKKKILNTLLVLERNVVYDKVSINAPFLWKYFFFFFWIKL